MDQKDTNKENAFEKKSQSKSMDKMIVTVSAALVLTALTLTGVYISSNQSQKQIEDNNNLTDNGISTPLLEELGDLQSVDSADVENPGRTGAGSSDTAVQKDAAKTSNTLLSSAIEEIAEPVLTDEAIAEIVENMMLSFNGTNMLWPISQDNEILIPYSMDKAVYFETLDQYKYNPAMIISAEIGTPVAAVSAGRIIDKYWNEETGWTYAMDLGGGFTVYYGQLDNLQKEVDTYVVEGDILGYVAAPTKYYSEEGSNLYFAMTRNGNPVYPMDYVGE